MRLIYAFQIIILVIALVISSCTTSGLDEESIDELFKNTPSQKIEIVADGGYANYDLEPQNRVIKDSDAFNHFWEELHSPRDPIPPLPSIDFANNMVLISIMGSKPHGGYVIQIDKAIYNDNTLAVKVVKTSPKNCFTTQAITNPYSIVKVEKTDTPVKFFEKSIVSDCSK